jgi:hypothetical protein
MGLYARVWGARIESWGHTPGSGIDLKETLGGGCLEECISFAQEGVMGGQG